VPHILGAFFQLWEDRAIGESSLVMLEISPLRTLVSVGVWSISWPSREKAVKKQRKE
jgi:hypothetical protein